MPSSHVLLGVVFKMGDEVLTVFPLSQYDMVLTQSVGDLTHCNFVVTK